MIIGFTGHQRILHPDRWSWVKEKFTQILRKVAHPGDRVISSLASGGDQVFSQVALSEGLQIEVVIPCFGYEAAFQTPDDLRQYEVLLARAARLTRLDFSGPSEEAFLEAGIQVINQSGLVVALWNGKPAAGKGGTAEIVNYARKQGIPVIQIDPDKMEVSGTTETIGP